MRRRDPLQDTIILKHESKERCIEFWTVLLWITTGFIPFSCTTAKTFPALERAVRFLHDDYLSLSQDESCSLELEGERSVS